MSEASVTRDYHVEAVVTGWLGNAYPIRNELLRRLKRADCSALTQFVQETIAACRAANQQPIQVVGTGLMYGMVTGILIEDERRGRSGGYNHGFSRFDVCQVVQNFLTNVYPERRDLVANITGCFRDSEIVKRFTLQIGMVCASEKLDPAQTIAFCMRHGMGVGILLEKDRVQRQVTLVH